MMNMLPYFALLVTTLCAVVTCYDFSDSAYNAILEDEMNDIYESLESASPNTRHRRDEESVTKENCHNRKRRMCCGEATFRELHDKKRDEKRECFKKFMGKDPHYDPFNCEKMIKMKNDLTCAFQCIGQRNDILDKDGNPQEAEFTSFVKEILAKESWFASIQDKVIPTCLAEAWNATEHRDASDSETCNPAGIKLGHCLFREIQLNCPADQIKDEKACLRLRDKLEKNNDFFPGPPPPHFMSNE